MNTKNKKTINKAKIIELIASNKDMREAIDTLMYEAISRDKVDYISLIKPIVVEMYKVFEDCITTALSNVKESEDLNITLLNGLHIKAAMLPPVEQYNKLTGQTIITKPKIKAKASFSRYFLESLIEGNSDNEDKN